MLIFLRFGLSDKPESSIATVKTAIRHRVQQTLMLGILVTDYRERERDRGRERELSHKTMLH